MNALRMVFVLTALGISVNGAAGQGSDTKVKVKPSASQPNAMGYVDLHFDIAIDKGWHIYANPPRYKELDPAKTLVRFLNPKVEVAAIQYPEGKAWKDPQDGTEYRVYEDNVRITARLKRTDASPLQVQLDVYACNDKKCLPKGTVKLTIP